MHTQVEDKKKERTFMFLVCDACLLIPELHKAY